MHHIAWTCPDAEHVAWQQRVRDAGRHVTEVLDRDYFKSVYFREPGHVLKPPRLTGRQRQALIEVYEAFIGFGPRPRRR